jgi:hypothetical protein
MIKGAEALTRANPGPKLAPPLRWLQLTVLGMLFFVICNEVDSPHLQLRLEHLRPADKPRCEDRLHLTIVRDRGLDVLMMPRVALQFTRNNC